MLPARYLLWRHYDSYGGCISNSYMGFQKPPSAVSSSEFMGGFTNCEEREGEEVATSSRDVGDQLCEEKWLQLGIGEGIWPSSVRHSPEISSSADRQRALGLELQLFSPGPVVQRPMIPVFPPPATHFSVFYSQENPWELWSAGSLAVGIASPAVQQPVRNVGLPVESSDLGYSEIRVLRPPERQAAGVWFLLRAADNQARKPFLPQICKSYLRIKDGRMTIRLLKKYLASKLGLDNESEVEISCRGQQLLPLLTLQHVRDNIWQLHETSTSLTLVPESSYIEHLMTLQYGRSS